jgi:DNA-binding MarR family transcriptional regulator
MAGIDRIIHEPARLKVMTVLDGVKEADFTFLTTALGLTNGNLSSHIDRLEKADYVNVRKSFQGKMPRTTLSITPAGRDALHQYWEELERIRRLKPDSPPAA